MKKNKVVKGASRGVNETKKNHEKEDAKNGNETKMRMKSVKTRRTKNTAKREKGGADSTAVVKKDFKCVGLGWNGDEALEDPMPPQQINTKKALSLFIVHELWTVYTPLLESGEALCDDVFSQPLIFRTRQRLGVSVVNCPEDVDDPDLILEVHVDGPLMQSPVDKADLVDRGILSNLHNLLLTTERRDIHPSLDPRRVFWNTRIEASIKIYLGCRGQFPHSGSIVD